ncbi:MAG: efflux RND transporter periplasmic adaptor subunit [Bacteroidales bacterium]|nr:efflux RND transporter periplasmic adaptor subunit [Bacteroidales bacterium]
MKKILGYAVAALLVAGMVLILFNNKKKNAMQASSTVEDYRVVVETLTVGSEPYSVTFSANGLTAPVKELKYVSDVSGRVVKIYVDNGSRVSRGTTLLEVDKELLQSDCDAALAAYESMKKNVERLQASKEIGGVSDQQLESLETQLIAARSRYDVSRRRLADATVKSPISGTVNMRYVEVGSLIAPNAPLFDIVDNSSFKVICNLPEGKIGKVSAGQAITLTPTSGEGGEFHGKVTFIGVKNDRGLNYPLEITLDKDSRLMAGMYLKADFSTENTSGILVPRSAIVGGLRSSMVYIYDNGTAVERPVVLGEMVGDRVEILSGLSDGDIIIVSGIMNVSDGTPVKTLN